MESEASSLGLLDEAGTRRVFAHGNSGPNALSLDGESVFEIGSMTKVFTGILLADMVRAWRGRACRSRSRICCRPTFVFPSRNGKAITLLDLTTHFSGLPFMPTNLAPAESREPLRGLHGEPAVRVSFRAMSLPRDPGDAFEYSNVGCRLAGSRTFVARRNDVCTARSYRNASCGGWE